MMNAQAIVEATDALNATGRVGTPLRATQRHALYDLLRGYVPELDAPTVGLVGERDLVALYEASLQSSAKGAAVAGNIARKYAPNPLLDPVTFKPAEQTPLVKNTYKPEYQQPPAFPPAPTPSDMREYARKSDVANDIRTLRNDLQTDYRRKLEETQRDLREDSAALKTNLTATLVAVTDALPEAVKAHTLAALKSLTPVTLTVVMPNEAPTPIGTVHRALPQLIKMLAAGGHVYLYGPAGSGKTTAAKQCADAFKLPFYFAAKVESEYMLLGFKDARGETVRTQFREAYEHGGVFLFDELDGSSPSAVVAMNAALANGICPFPDGTIQMHKNFKCVGGGNTKLSGATREYVGRNQLDAASVDRFDFLAWDYDDALESALASNANWCAYVQSARKAVKERALKHLVTPRATYRGCKLLEGGLTWEETETAVLWKGLDAETVLQLKGAMSVKAPEPVGIL